jgi:hypothetical protein
MDLKVFITSRESRCENCGEELGRYAWITLVESKGAHCLSCADLDHLVFLPSGDSAMTRRARKYSTLSAVVLKWSRARQRYERQGLLVEESALQIAEQECYTDAEARAHRREREAARRAELNQEYLQRFAARVRELLPSCPARREQVIADHACQKYSGRVGRSAKAKNLENDAILLAVIAHIRHAETNYDDLLSQGWDRSQARDQVKDLVDTVLDRWRGG